MANKPDALVLRRAGTGDIAALEACMSRAYAEAMATLADLPDVISGLDEDVTQGRVTVATVSGQIAGAIVTVAVDDRLLIANLGVDPDHGGRGIARQLLDRAERAARDLGCAGLALRTHAGLERTVAMYRHLGWRESGRTGNVISMQRDLTS